MIRTRIFPERGSKGCRSAPVAVGAVVLAAGFFHVLGPRTAALAVPPQAGNKKTLPTGAPLDLRLEAPVSTKSSHLKQPVAARIVREARSAEGAGDVLIPIGATVRGTIDKVIPSSSPTDRAKMRLKFTQLELPGASPMPLVGHVSDVENARESVLPDGSIQGVLASELPVTMIEGALEKFKKANPGMGGDAQKASEKTLGRGDTSIEYPAGTDLAFLLDQPITLDRTFPPAASDQLTPAAKDAVTRLLEEAPQRAEGKDGKPGDPLNLIFIGSADQIRKAFEDSGWAEAEKLTGKSLFETVRAVVVNKGYGSAPVSQLYLFGRAEDLAFQKMLNTFAARHHLRIWKSPVQTSDGREVWLSAATHDTGWDIRPGVVSHAIDPAIDNEREKVGADLLTAGAASNARLVTRPNPLSEGLTATGATWKTDGQLLALELKSP